jgi:ribosomal protein L32E
MRTLPDAPRALRKYDHRDPAKRQRRKRKKLAGLPFLGFSKPSWVRSYSPKGFANVA